MKVFVNNTKGLSARCKFTMECLLGVFFIYALSSSEGYSDLFSIHVTLLNLTLDMGYWYFPFAIFIISGAANAFNLTDGMDGLLSGVTLPILVALFCIGVFVTDFSSNIVNLLNTLTYIAALGGTVLGFLLFNRYPAKIFMGDSGSLMIGCSVAAVAVLLKIELLLGILCLIPVLEALSVILQVFFFKVYGRRILIMAPIHHHFEKKGARENTIVFAMSTVSFFAAIFTFAIAFLK